MALSSDHVCTLCNHEFSTDEDSPRCPYCLRLTGVVAMDGPAPAPRARTTTSPPARAGTVTRFRVLIAVSALAAIGLMVVAALFHDRLGPDDETRPLANWCRERNLPTPWDGKEEIVAELNLESSRVSAEQIVNLLEEKVSRRFVLYDRAEPPDRIHSVGELANLEQKAVTSLEAAIFSAVLVHAAGLDWAVCSSDSNPPVPFWKLTFALCDQDGTSRFVPFANNRKTTLRILEEEELLAAFLAAAAELPIPAREAYRLLGAARELADSPDLLFRLGAVKTANGAAEFGIENMREALAAGAAPQGYLELGETLMETGLPGQALTAYRRLLETDPDDPRGQLGTARALGVLGRIDEAAEILETLRQTDPEVPGLWHALSLVYERQDKIAEAIAALRKELDIHPRREHYQRLTGLYLTADRGREILPLLKKAYRDNPESYLAVLVARAMADDQTAAMEWVDKALKKHPANMELLAFLATLLRKEKKYREAEEVLMRLSERDPVNPDWRVHLAMCRFAQEKDGLEGTEEARETARKLGRENPQALLQLAGMLSGRGFEKAGEEILETRLAETGVEGKLTTWLYFLYLKHGKTERARQFRQEQLPHYHEEHRDWVERTMNRIDKHLAGQQKKNSQPSDKE